MTGKPGAAPPRARDAVATRADLLRAAKRRFATLGYTRTTSRDIAADAGANVSLIYRYFGSKEDLFELVLKESADLFDELRGTPLSELIDTFVASLEPTAYPEYNHEHPLAILLRGFGDDGRAQELRDRTLGAVVSYLAEEMAKSGGTEDARARARLLFSMMAGIVTLRSAIPGHPVDLEELRTQLQWVAGVIAQGH